MEEYLVDSNILIRLSNAADPLYSVAESALDNLKRNGSALCLVAMRTHRIPRLLTFNASHFLRCTEIEAINPIDIYQAV